MGLLDGEPVALVDLGERRPVLIVPGEDRLDHREMPDDLAHLIQAELVYQLLVDPKRLCAEVVSGRPHAATLIVAVVLHRGASESLVVKPREGQKVSPQLFEGPQPRSPIDGPPVPPAVRMVGIVTTPA